MLWCEDEEIHLPQFAGGRQRRLVNRSLSVGLVNLTLHFFFKNDWLLSIVKQSDHHKSLLYAWKALNHNFETSFFCIIYRATMPTSTSPFPSQSPVPRSGILTTPTGDRHIPPSTRADGSLRKEIKIRPGYRPPEDVEVYKNRTAEAWKTRGSGGVPGAEGLKDLEDGKSSTGKNAKRREARKRAKAAEGEEENESLVDRSARVEGNRQSSTDSKIDMTSNWRGAGPPPTEESQPEMDPEAEKEKQARNLKKKLRQARELREKKDKGENLLPEQFEKVIKIQELIRQLDNLGFDSDGAKKAKDV